ncbi:hypothetical protein HYALB_00011292 [Hymenoscyphus albidus]|uniref:Uncharacterized protein n=1 Tax=Hymenoscyphus albidus TaxID=595503 RepID=A0A9N9LFD2_9HELO|nr:hypothetical protein HYALB_00011292 [Hymenoscyphus albidus]
MHTPNSSIDDFILSLDDQDCLENLDSDIQVYGQSNGFIIPGSGLFSDLDYDPAVLEQLNNFSYDDNACDLGYLDSLLATGGEVHDAVEATHGSLEGEHVSVKDGSKNGEHGLREVEHDSEGERQPDEEERDTAQNPLQVACANQTTDPSDFFFKSFPHSPCNLDPKPTTKGSILNSRKRKATQGEHHSLGSPKRITTSPRNLGECNDDDQRNGSETQNNYTRAMVCSPPDNAIAVARRLGVQSAVPLYRKSTERNAVAKDFSSLQISGPLYLTLLAAAKSYMLDDKHPERREFVGRNARTTDVSGMLSSCCEEFLEQGWGEKCWGIGAEVHEGFLQWPLNRRIIVKLTVPLLRRIVSNERQRLYAAQKRKRDSTSGSRAKRRKTADGNLNIYDSPMPDSPPDSVTSSIPSTPYTPNTPLTAMSGTLPNSYTSSIRNTPNISNTSLTPSFHEGNQKRQYDELPELSAMSFQIQHPLAGNANMEQCQYNYSPERSPPTSTSGSTSEESETGLTSSSTSQRYSSATEAIIGLSTGATDYKTNIKLHTNFFWCGQQVRSDANLSIAIPTEFSPFVERLRSLVPDLLKLKRISIIGPEGSIQIDNSETLGKILMDIEDSVWMDGEAKALVELEEIEEGTYYGEEREV